jgi:hypothetical protein
VGFGKYPTLPAIAMKALDRMSGKGHIRGLHPPIEYTPIPHCRLLRIANSR